MSETPERSRSRPARIAGAATLYFAIVFGVGLLLGPIRVLWLEPRLGKTIATFCETPFLIAAMIFGARFAAARFAFRAETESLALIGAIALCIQQVADFGIGLARGIPPENQVAYFATPAGLIYLVSLLAFAVMPALVGRAVSRR